MNELLEAIKDILSKRNEPENHKRLAENGDELAQMILGEIYFYGITADDEYWKALDEIIALSLYSERRHKCTYAHICFCCSEPDYREALKWYEMAAANGNRDAEEKVNEIKSGVVRMRKSTLIQRFDRELIERTAKKRRKG